MSGMMHTEGQPCVVTRELNWFFRFAWTNWNTLLSEMSLTQRKCEASLKLSSACPCFTEERKTMLSNQEWHKCQEIERSSTRVMILLMRHDLTNAQSALWLLFSTTLSVKPWPVASSTRRVITPQRAEPVVLGNAEQHQICEPTDLTSMQW